MKSSSVALVFVCLFLAIDAQEIQLPEFFPAKNGAEIDYSKSALHSMSSQERRRLFHSDKVVEPSSYSIFHLASMKTLQRRSINDCPPFVNLSLGSANVRLERNTIDDALLIDVEHRAMRNRSLTSKQCHYHFANGDQSLAMSIGGEKMHALLITPNGTVRIAPLPRRLLKMRFKRDADAPFSLPENAHVAIREIERADESKSDASPTLICAVDEQWQCPDGKCKFEFHAPPEEIVGRTAIQLLMAPKTLELGLFMDAHAYEAFFGSEGVFDDFDELIDFLASYANQVALLFRSPSLGQTMQVRVAFMKILTDVKNHPFKTYEGELIALMKDFGRYQRALNPKDDTDPHHWDHALLLTATDLKAKGAGSSALGAALEGSMCDPLYSLSVVELGTDKGGAEYAHNAGFLSAYSAAHEIGHSIGLSHDGSGSNNKCSRNQFIMASVKSFAGQTGWSECSREQFHQSVALRTCLDDATPTTDNGRVARRRSAGVGASVALPKEPPGQLYNLDDQCQIHMKNEDWSRDERQPLGEMCRVLKCRQEDAEGKQRGFPVQVGPALPGSFCGDGRWCQHGECVKYAPLRLPVRAGGWSAWRHSGCQTSCLQGSLGARLLRRECTSPKRKNSLDGCQGARTRLELCNADNKCGRKTPLADFLRAKCRQYARVSDYVAPSGGGRQEAHDASDPEKACRIYCADAESPGDYWHPYDDVLWALGEEAFLPDGVECDRDAQGRRAYCQQHRCILA